MKIWKFDENHRVYPKNNKGLSAPIYREHWVEHEVVEETKQSWILSNGQKVPKNPGKRHESHTAFSLEEVEKQVWAHDHRYKISELVYRCNIDELKKIAEIIGYDN